MEPRTVAFGTGPFWLCLIGLDEHATDLTEVKNT